MCGEITEDKFVGMTLKELSKHFKIEYIGEYQIKTGLLYIQSQEEELGLKGKE